MTNKELRIGVIGTGYVGLVTGTCLAELGRQVICCDVNEEKIRKLNDGIIPIYEPGLEELVKNNRERLTFTTDIKYTVQNSDIIFIAVGTPMGEDGSADLQYVLSVAISIGKYMDHNIFVVDKSTVPVGTAEKVEKQIWDSYFAKFEDGDTIPADDGMVEVLSNPEFLKEGSAIADFSRPDRIVVGHKSEEAKQVMYDLYYPLVRDDASKLIFMDIKSAEMTKYAANSMLATKISFMNEMANICERVGADVNMVRKGIGSDTRIGPKFLYAGCGYGGSCFPKDVQALIKTAHDFDYTPELIEATERVNLKQKYVMANKVLEKFGDDLKGYCFGIWGLAFKPNTDDMREAPAIYVIKTLLEHGAKIKAYDPKATFEAQNCYLKDLDVEYCSSKYDAIKDCNALILLTEWREFQLPDFFEIKKNLKMPIIFDGRNQYGKLNLPEKGFDYYQIGVKHV
mgnify:CR=1 FL=1